MAEEDILIGVLIHSAWNLPKLDLIGVLDPYVKMRFGEKTLKTRVIDNDPSPVWNEAFFWRTLRAGVPERDVLRFDIWDADTVGSDDHAAFGSLPLGVYQDKILDLTLARGVSPASGGQPAMKLWAGFVLDYSALRARLSKSTPGAVFDDDRRRVLVPAPELGEGFFVGVEYDSSGERLHFLMLTSARPDDEVAYNISWSDRHGLEISYRFTPAPLSVSGCAMRQLWQVANIPIYDRFSNLMIERADVEPELECTLWEIARAYGWREGLDFDSAKQTLRNAIFHPDKPLAYLQLEDFILALEWRDGNLFWKLLIFDNFENRNALIDVRSSRPTRVRFERYNQVRELGSTPLIGHIDLDGVAGLNDDLIINASQRRYLTQWRLTDLIPLHG